MLSLIDRQTELMVLPQVYLFLLVCHALSEFVRDVPDSPSEQYHLPGDVGVVTVQVSSGPNQ